MPFTETEEKETIAKDFRNIAKGPISRFTFFLERLFSRSGFEKLFARIIRKQSIEFIIYLVSIILTCLVFFYASFFKDDVESMDGGDDGYETPRVTPSPTLLPHFPPSQHSDKVFLEKDSGFRSTSQRKLATNLTGNQIQNPDLQKPTKTPLDVSLESQRVFRSIGIFCHGFLAGLAFWQLIMVSNYVFDLYN